MGERIDDVAFRINDPHMLRRHYAPYILRTMNRVYQRLNRETKCLEKSVTFDFSTLDPLVNYWAIPSDMIEPFRIEPILGYRNPQQFVFADDAEVSGAETGTFTIANGKFHFSSVTAESLYEIWYYSTGLVLVDKEDADLLEGEINTPEWPWEALHQLLFYATCIEISNSYPMYEQDYRRYEELKQMLHQACYHKQSITPNIMGGYGQRTVRDPYG
jgi:hypothetical protein